MSGDQWEFLNNLNKKSGNKDGNGFMNFGLSEMGSFPKSNVPQMVPQPSGIPWSINGMSWGSSVNQNSPVEFTATPLDRNKIFNSLHCKRKAEIEPKVPRKQLITEEKMTASFDGMHISGDYTTHNINTDSNDGDTVGMDVEVQGPRVVLSPELMRVQTEPILPASLLQRLEKPCTSLVLWRAPKKILQTEEEINDPNNNPEEGAERSRRRGVLGSMVEDITSNSPSTSSSNSSKQIFTMDVL